MRHALLTSCLWFCAGLTLGCDARGVRVGTEELCVADEDLLVAQAGTTEIISTCATIGPNQLANADFESPDATCDVTPFCQLPALQVGWKTSSQEQLIEVWVDGYHGVPAPQGLQFMELDATSRDTLWQEVELPPNQLMYWSLLHRGRNGVEAFDLEIGAPDAVTSLGPFSSPANEWSLYRGLYRTGPNETRTRFALVSLSGLAEGNLIDAVVFAPVD